MASERRQVANQKNAKQSTGPRTAQGKFRAKLNALRHGLATKQTALPQIERMARAICGIGATRLLYEEALNVAVSQFMLDAVRVARVATIKLTVAPKSAEQVGDSGEPAPKGEVRVASEEPSEIEGDRGVLLRALPELARYDRYERRALSRRRRAIRSFVATSILGTRPTRGRR
jgi:hypothetical protein